LELTEVAQGTEGYAKKILKILKNSLLLKREPKEMYIERNNISQRGNRRHSFISVAFWVHSSEV